MDVPRLTEEDKKRVILNPSKKSQFIEQLELKLKKQIIGQDEAIDNILNSIDRVVAGVKSKEKPVLTMLFLGPTGTGKTECVKVLSEVLFGKRDAFVRVNCQELTSEHMIARLFGSPPGYIGNEIEPMLSQTNIDKFCKKAVAEKTGIFSASNDWGKKLYDVTTGDYISIVLFDEIEKAHHRIWTSLLSAMDDGTLVLGKNETVSLKNTIIIMTTNVGSQEIDKTLKGNAVGFNISTEEKKQVDIKKKAFEEVKGHFPPEFCNRFDEVVAFKMLTPEDIERIIGVQLKYFFKDLVEAKIPLYIRYTNPFIKFIVKEGFNQQYGARHLNRTIKNKLISPLSKLLTTQQLIVGDVMTVDYDKDEVIFIREPRTEEQLRKIQLNETNKQLPEQQLKQKKVSKKGKTKSS